MTVRICVSIGASRVTEILPLIDKAEVLGANLLEIRLDYFRNLDGIEKIIRETSIPLIAANRQVEQGGRKLQSERNRIGDLLKIATQGFAYADIELTLPNVDQVTAELVDLNVKPIVSFHDFEKTPELGKLRNTVASQIEAGAEICKLVTTANRLGDNLALFSLISEISPKKKIVCFAMGNEGIVSRVLSPLFGADFTYASLQEGRETAPAQLPIQRLKTIYQDLEVQA